MSEPRMTSFAERLAKACGRPYAEFAEFRYIYQLENGKNGELPVKAKDGQEAMKIGKAQIEAMGVKVKGAVAEPK